MHEHHGRDHRRRVRLIIGERRQARAAAPLSDHVVRGPSYARVGLRRVEDLLASLEDALRTPPGS